MAYLLKGFWRIQSGVLGTIWFLQELYRNYIYFPRNYIYLDLGQLWGNMTWFDHWYDSFISDHWPISCNMWCISIRWFICHMMHMKHILYEFIHNMYIYIYIVYIHIIYLMMCDTRQNMFWWWGNGFPGFWLSDWAETPGDVCSADLASDARWVLAWQWPYICIYISLSLSLSLSLQDPNT